MTTKQLETKTADKHNWWVDIAILWLCALLLIAIFLK